MRLEFLMKYMRSKRSCDCSAGTPHRGDNEFKDGSTHWIGGRLEPRDANPNSFVRRPR